PGHLVGRNRTAGARPAGDDRLIRLPGCNAANGLQCDVRPVGRSSLLLGTEVQDLMPSFFKLFEERIHEGQAFVRAYRDAHGFRPRCSWFTLVDEPASALIVLSAASHAGSIHPREDQVDVTLSNHSRSCGI